MHPLQTRQFLISLMMQCHRSVAMHDSSTCFRWGCQKSASRLRRHSSGSQIETLSNPSSPRKHQTQIAQCSRSPFQCLQRLTSVMNHVASSSPASTARLIWQTRDPGSVKSTSYTLTVFEDSERNKAHKSYAVGCINPIVGNLTALCASEALAERLALTTYMVEYAYIHDDVIEYAADKSPEKVCWTQSIPCSELISFLAARN